MSENQTGGISGASSGGTQEGGGGIPLFVTVNNNITQTTSVRLEQGKRKL